jgi:hypothetical protein
MQSWAILDFGLANIELSFLDPFQQVVDIGTIVYSGVAILLQATQNCILICINSHICFPYTPFLFTIVQDSGQLGLISTHHVAHIMWSNIMVKQQLVGLSYILGLLRRLDVHPEFMLTINVRHDITNSALVISKCCPLVRIMVSYIFDLRSNMHPQDQLFQEAINCQYS